MHAKLKQGAIAGNRATRFGCCRLCGAPLATTFVNLGMSPLCESFLPRQRDRQDGAIFSSPRAGLRGVLSGAASGVCTAGAHLQRVRIFFVIFHVMGRACTPLLRDGRTTRFGLGPTSQVFEIASNDGYLLQHFLPLGVPVVGIEPAANVAEAARA